jgi:hypothetical protein
VQPDFAFPLVPGGHTLQSSPFLHRFGGFSESGFGPSFASLSVRGCRQNRKTFLFSGFTLVCVCVSDLLPELSFRISGTARSLTGCEVRDPAVVGDRLGSSALRGLLRSRTLRSAEDRDGSAPDRDDDLPSFVLEDPEARELDDEEPP